MQFHYKVLHCERTSLTADHQSITATLIEVHSLGCFSECTLSYWLDVLQHIQCIHSTSMTIAFLQSINHYVRSCCTNWSHIRNILHSFYVLVGGFLVMTTQLLNVSVVFEKLINTETMIGGKSDFRFMNKSQFEQHVHMMGRQVGACV